jgi:hypothetical protein
MSTEESDMDGWEKMKIGFCISGETSETFYKHTGINLSCPSPANCEHILRQFKLLVH